MKKFTLLASALLLSVTASAGISTHLRQPANRLANIEKKAANNVNKIEVEKVANARHMAKVAT